MLGTKVSQTYLNTPNETMRRVYSSKNIKRPMSNESIYARKKPNIDIMRRSMSNLSTKKVF